MIYTALTYADSISCNSIESCYSYAKQGDPDAQYNLAFYYNERQKTKKTLRKYIDWLQQSANNGISEAWNDLGILYRDGIYLRKKTQKRLFPHFVNQPK